jgi:transmembrane sensor
MDRLGDQIAAWLRRRRAAAFAARFASDQASDADWAALTAWLEADPLNGRALEALGNLEALAAARGRPKVRTASRQLSRGSPWVWLLPASGLCIACAGLALLIVPATHQLGMPGPSTQNTPLSFASGDSSRMVVLPDSTRVWLNRKSRMTARFDTASRKVELAQGSQAAFDVTHAADRPFTISVADRQVSVVGTAFDIASQGDRLVVAVSRGIVRVSRPDGSRPVRLLAGQQIVHRVGAPGETLSPIAKSQVAAWRNGQLVYDDAPLQTVADDLVRYFDRPVVLTRSAQALRFTGVLAVDDQALVLRRLEVFLPVSARIEADRIVLSARAAH